MKKSVVILLLCGFLAGCGFHLRGIEHFPPELRVMTLETKYPNTPMMLALREQLMNNGTVLTESAKDALTVLTLSELSIDDQAIALLGGGQASIHRLTDSVTYTLREAKTRKILAGPETVQASRNYSTNASLILSDEYVSNQISQGLQQDLAAQIFEGLSRVELHETPTS